VRSLPIELLHPGRFQPRRRFDEESLKALAESVTAQGVLQPILVRQHPNLPGAYEILAGERRWRAAQRARLHEVPVVVRPTNDRDAMELALVENIQREDLLPLEEARGYERLIAEFGQTQEALAQRVGKSRSHIANTLRLLTLPNEVKQMLDDQLLTAGHARALLTAPDPVGLAREAVSKEWSVRQTEQAAHPRERAAAEAAPPKPAPRNPDIVALEQDISAYLGMKATIRPETTQSGILSIHYRTLDQFEEVTRRLKRSNRN
jgi:ParB family chromosome partitioning protein